MSIVNVLVITIMLSTALENVDPPCHMISHKVSRLFLKTSLDVKLSSLKLWSTKKVKNKNYWFK